MSRPSPSRRWRQSAPRAWQPSRCPSRCRPRARRRHTFPRRQAAIAPGTESLRRAAGRSVRARRACPALCGALLRLFVSALADQREPFAQLCRQRAVVLGVDLELGISGTERRLFYSWRGSGPIGGKKNAQLVEVYFQVAGQQPHVIMMPGRVRRLHTRIPCRVG